MNEMTTILFEIKSKLASIGIDLSDNQFSGMLAKSPRYISWIRATNHEPALESMVTLYSKLDDLADRYTTNGDMATASQIDEMATNLWQAIRRASLAQVPPRRRSSIHQKQGQGVAHSQHAAK